MTIVSLVEVAGSATSKGIIHTPEERITLVRKHLDSRFHFEQNIPDDRTVFAYLLAFMRKVPRSDEGVIQDSDRDHSAWMETGVPPYYVDVYYEYASGDYLHKAA